MNSSVKARWPNGSLSLAGLSPSDIKRCAEGFFTLFLLGIDIFHILWYNTLHKAPINSESEENIKVTRDIMTRRVR